VSDKIPVANEQDVDTAVKAAEQAFLPTSPWRSMTALDRQRLLLKFADILEANTEYLAKLTRRTLGAPFLPFGKSEIDTAITCFRCMSIAELINEALTMNCTDYAGWTDKYSGQSFPADDGFYKIVRHEPIGVVAGYVRAATLAD
jgi:acyl-CoA reductase-like NAD-dependent aldehyde dehydrogenase